MGLIYMAKFSNRKKYVGQTKQNLNARIAQHISASKKDENNKSSFHEAIRKYGADDIIWSILEQDIPDDELNDKEIFWIQNKKSYIKEDGYNLTRGGDSSDHKISIDKDSDLAVTIYEEYKAGSSTVEIGKKYGYATNTINHLLNRIDTNWKKYARIGRGHVFKLNDEKSKQIYELYKAGEKINDIAITFGVQRSTISNTLKRVDSNYKEYQNYTKFSPNVQREIYDKFNNGATVKQLSRDYNCSWETIKKVINRLNEN